MRSACWLVLFFTLTVPTQAADEASYRLALKAAVRLAETAPEQGASRLKDLLAQLDADRGLPAERRDALRRVVKDRLRVATAGPLPVSVVPERVRPVSREAERVRAALAGVAELAKAGKAAEAERTFLALLRDHEAELTVKAEAVARLIEARQDELGDVKRAKEKGVQATLQAVERSAVANPNDVTFPKDFKARSAQRKALDTPSAEERRALQALETSIDARFKDTPLEDVAETLSTLVGLSVLLDKPALDANGINYATPVTFSLRSRVPLRFALRGLLAQLGLTYVVKDGVILVTTPERAREFLTVKVYRIGDLIKPLDLSGPAAELLNAAFLIDAIVSTVDPLSWEWRGGAGSIRYLPAQGILVIRQSAEIHGRLRGGIAN
jgi:hypothetical protein